MPEIYKNQLRWLWLSWMVLMIDQTIKWYVVRYLVLQEAIQINPYFNLFLDYNKGAAFSLLRNESGWQRWLFVGIALMASIIIIYWLYEMPRRNHLSAASLALILGGALGNMIDRIICGHVVDYISWHIQQYYWPTFNLADAAVCLGVFLYIVSPKHDRQK